MSFQAFFYVIIHFHTHLNQKDGILNKAIYISKVFLIPSATRGTLTPLPVLISVHLCRAGMGGFAGLWGMCVVVLTTPKPAR